MSNLKPDDDTTNGSNIVNPPDGGRHGPTTRQQSTADAMAQAAAAAAAAAAHAEANPAPAVSQGAQSVTATFDYHSLAAAMSHPNDSSASNLEKGTQPKWDCKTETFVNWQNKVEIWADSHDTRDLLEHPPVAALGQLRKHEIAKRIMLPTLPNHDRAYVRGSQTLNEIGIKLLAKYMPSIDAEAQKFWSKFSALRQSGRQIVEHVNDCKTVANLLEATGETVPDKQFVDKLLNIDLQLSYLRPMLVRAPIAEIVAGLTDGYSYHYQDRQHQNHSGNAGRGRFQRRHPRGQGAPAAAAGIPAMARVNAVSAGEERACYNCNKIGHLREDYPEVYQEVRHYLKKRALAAGGHGRGRARGKGRGGPGIAAISVAEVQNMVDSLSGAESVFLPDKWLIDSGSDINICYNYDLFSYIGPSDIEQCTPLGSTPLPVQGKGVVKMCVRNYMDHNGLSHSVDLEIENV